MITWLALFSIMEGEKMTVDDKALDLCCCRYPEDIFSVCRVMTDEGLGDPVDRLDDEHDLD